MVLVLVLNLVLISKPKHTDKNTTRLGGVFFVIILETCHAAATPALAAGSASTNKVQCEPGAGLFHAFFYPPPHRAALHLHSATPPQGRG